MIGVGWGGGSGWHATDMAVDCNSENGSGDRGTPDTVMSVVGLSENIVTMRCHMFHRVKAGSYSLRSLLNAVSISMGALPPVDLCQ